MEYGVILIVTILSFVIMAWALQIKIKDFKRLKELGFDEKVTKQVLEYPNDETICKKMLQILGNKEVKVKTQEDGKQKTSLYIVATNTIWVANLQDTCTRIQTVAHECIHAMQNKTTLWFQYIFSNIYPLYFIMISILTLCGKVHHPMVQVIILLTMGIIFFCVRGYLEMDAMLKAKPLAKEYMDTVCEVSNKTKQAILQRYEEINQLGIKIAFLQLWIKPIIRVCIYCAIVILM